MQQVAAVPGLHRPRVIGGRWDQRHHVERWCGINFTVMLVRREGESFVALLQRLDRSIAKAREQEITIDEVNG